ncbi:I78 family peptidase inhibitor [Lysobacter niabensis]|uniref:I78 family peptidase inhibitor n=1 Tax=Agrilutibacter niabensis TaxID=380628 RepID=UPI00360D8C4E
MARYSVAIAALLLTTLAACTTSEPSSPEASASAPSTPAASEPATPAPPATPATPPAQRGCDSEAARSFVGQVATAAVIEQARSAAGAEIARTLKPGQMVTMEFHASRLNIDVDAGNAITNVRCG